MSVSNDFKCSSYIIQSTKDVLKVVIRAPRRWSSILVSGMLLLPWALAELGVSVFLISDLKIAIVLVPWICIWTGGGVVLVLNVLARISGVEELCVADHKINMKRRIGTFKLQSRSLDLYDIQKIWVSPIKWGKGRQWTSYTLTISSRSKTYFFGRGLGQGELQTLAKVLQDAQQARIHMPKDLQGS